MARGSIAEQIEQHTPHDIEQHTPHDIEHHTGPHIRRQLAGLAADTYGVADSRPPLVLLHGLTFDRTIWQPVLDQLRPIDPNRQVLVLDLPGHGESPNLPPHTTEAVVGVIRHAVDEAGLDAPVMVGHSMSGGIASVYAARHPTRGLVNVDAPPDLAPVARLLQSVADQVRGSGFPAVWQMMEQSFHTELLPPSARDLVSATSRPTQELVLSYWQELLDTPPEQLGTIVAAEMDQLRAAGVPYLLITGAQLPPGLRNWIRDALPQATVEVWPRSGHFPHLAHPARFAKRLADTAAWPEAPIDRAESTTELEQG